MDNISKTILTSREADILLKITECKSNSIIAKELVISQSTVRKHIEHIYNKLGVHNRVQLIIKAFKYNLVKFDK